MSAAHRTLDRVGRDPVMFGSDMIGIEVSWTPAQWIDQVRSFGELSKRHGGEITQAGVA